LFNEQLRELESGYDFRPFRLPAKHLARLSCGVFSANEIYVPRNPDALASWIHPARGEIAQFQQLSASFRVAQMVARGCPGDHFNSIRTAWTSKCRRCACNAFEPIQGPTTAWPNRQALETQIRDATIVRRAVALGLRYSVGRKRRVGQVVE